MGAYQIFKITFKSKKARDWFENKLIGVQKPRRLFQDNCLKEHGELECCYYMGFDGYALGKIILKQLKKAKLINEIVDFNSMDLNCENEWYNELVK